MSYGSTTLHMTTQGLAEMFEGDFADTCAKTHPLMSMGGTRGWSSVCRPVCKDPHWHERNLFPYISSKYIIRSDVACMSCIPTNTLTKLIYYCQAQPEHQVQLEAELALISFYVYDCDSFQNFTMKWEGSGPWSPLVAATP